MYCIVIKWLDCDLGFRNRLPVFAAELANNRADCYNSLSGRSVIVVQVMFEDKQVALKMQLQQLLIMK